MANLKNLRQKVEETEFPSFRREIVKLLARKEIVASSLAIQQLQKRAGPLVNIPFIIRNHKLPTVAPPLSAIEEARQNGVLEILAEFDQHKAHELKEIKQLLLEAELQFYSYSLKDTSVKILLKHDQALRFTLELLLGELSTLQEIPRELNLACNGLADSEILAIAQKVKKELGLSDEFLQSLNFTKQDADRSL